MGDSDERKITGIRVSVNEKTNLMRYFGTTNFSAIIRRLLGGKPVLLTLGSQRLLMEAGFESLGAADKVQDCVHQALDFAVKNGFKYEGFEDLEKKEILDNIEIDF